ncbi:MAG: 3-carboxy-cis,cis-muconate cycloisomerase [Candidatus Acidiferrum sp.]
MSLYDPLFRYAGLDAVFSDRSTLQRMLDFEGALARAEAAVGVIPAGSANIISSRCRVDDFDSAELAQHAANAGNIAIPLIKKLTESVASENKDAARFVHWGATSQDVIDTAVVLQIREAFEFIIRDLDGLIATLASLAERHQSTPIAARTWMQQALPTTFGFIVAGWLDALLRHRQRLGDIRPRVLALQFGGAVGTLAALGQRGPEVGKALAKELGLSLPSLSWHTHRDRVAEVGCFCALLAGTLGKIARDISLHAQTEIAELSEPAEEGRGGSSTLPHKRNPITCAVVLSAAQRVPGLAGTLLSSLPQEQQRGLGGWHAEWETLPEIIKLTGGSLHHLANMVPGLVVDVDQMRRNLEITNGLIFAEAVSMALADRMGKMPAHLLVEAAAKKSLAKHRHLKDVLLDEPGIRGYLTPADLASLFAPDNYLGSAKEFVANVLNEVNSSAAR